MFEECKTAFRLFAFTENLASQGQVSTHHVFAPTSHWLRHSKPARPATGR
jgi:hypothetical protein